METFDVRLPNGSVIKGIPKGTSKEVIKDKAIKNGLATAADFASSSTEGAPAPTPAPIDTATESLAQQNLSRLPASVQQGGGGVLSTDSLPTMGSMGEAVAANMDIPGGIAGAMTGAKLGTPFGLPGVIAGGIGGGAVGTFGGSIVSDYLKGEEADFSDAAKKAAISGVIDTATLGAATKFKPVAKLMGFGDGELDTLWKTITGPDPFGRTAAKVLPVGTPESLRQTQAFLESGGGSLTAFQTGNASALQNISEGIGRIGVGSSTVFKNLDKRNAATIGQELQKMMDESLLPSENMGSMVYGIIQAGKDAAQSLYDTATVEAGAQIGSRVRFNTGPILAEMKRFVKGAKTDWGKDLSPETLDLISTWTQRLGHAGPGKSSPDFVPSVDYKSLMAFQRRLNTEISELGRNAFGKTRATPASRELAQLSKLIRERTASLVSDANPQAGAALKAANKAYGEAMDGILPKINANIITRADTGQYESIAKVIEGSNPEQVEAFMNSIDVAYNNARLAGIDTGVLDVPSAEAARSVIKAGWLKNLFSEVTEEGFDPAKFAAKATEFKRPVNSRRAKAVLGDDYATFQMLLNAMAESTKQRTGFVGSLVLRSKEAGAVAKTAQSVAGGFTLGAGALPTAGAIFLGPVLLAKAATNPAAVRALLDGNRRAATALAAGKISVASDITSSTMASVMGMFSEEDQAEIRNSYR
jgi:hypothetical protein